MENKLPIFSFFCISIVLYTKIDGIGAKPPSKIIGGEDVLIEEFPSVILIYMDDYHLCGGTLITNKHVVTAAHCVVYQPENSTTYTEEYYPEELLVCGGSSDTGNFSHCLEVETINVHEDYTGDPDSDYEHDITILTLISEIPVSSKLKPINLPSKNTYAGEVGTILGWGYTSVNGSLSTTLKGTQTIVQDTLKCEPMRKTQLCVANGCGVGFCDGDSGGPLIIDDEIVGVISSSIGCATGSPDYLTRVYSYLDWIHNIIEPNLETNELESSNELQHC
ncbi:chymotrypsin-2-like [Diachasmimorpha longicaudata]|uniref:chymotrypsin-2-like n=1 Tax=Diachasmimorpha longicaudata TaxID=58733 RepID=UPI0030B885E7